MNDKNNLSFNGEIFIPINIAKDYLDYNGAIYKLESLYFHFKDFLYPPLPKGLLDPLLHETREEIYIDGMVIIRDKTLLDVRNVHIFDELQSIAIEELALCYGAVNGKECDEPTTYPFRPPVSFTICVVYAKQSDLDELAESYGIPKKLCFVETESIEVASHNGIIPMKELVNRNDTFYAIKHYINEFERDHCKTPSFNELWPILLKADLSHWDVAITKNDKRRTKQRYLRYYPASDADS